MPSFTDLGVPSDIAELLASAGVKEPFPIQAATIPDALAGKDICAKAPTGSGKTLSFVIPMVEGITRSRPRSPRGLVLVPTRELASQVQEALEPLAKMRGLRSLAVYGGTSMNVQLRVINRGVDIIVATPGRLQDLVDRNALKLSDVKIAVLDEADRMADMGFLPAVSKLLDDTSPDRQTVLYSATLDGQVDKLVKKYQTNPVKHEVEGSDDAVLATHVFWRVEKGDRMAQCQRIVEVAASSIVFCRTKRGADRLARQLSDAGIRLGVLHGDRSQSQREKALEAFTDGRTNVLIATDVAARGIHVDDISCVVHFDVPADEKDYVHRSGRTARAGSEGVVVSFVGGGDVGVVKRMLRVLKFDHTIIKPHFGDLRNLLPTERIIKPRIKKARSADDKFENERPRRSGSRSSGGKKYQGKRTESRDGRPAENRYGKKKFAGNGAPKAGSKSGGKPNGGKRTGAKRPARAS